MYRIEVDSLYWIGRCQFSMMISAGHCEVWEGLHIACLNTTCIVLVITSVESSVKTLQWLQS